MSLNPELVRAAIARKDTAGVRDLLRDATEADRRACARALRPLLRDDPGLLRRLYTPDPARRQPVSVDSLDLPEPVRAVLGFLTGASGQPGGTGFLRAFSGHGTPELREHQQLMKLRRSTAFLAAALGLAGGAAAAARDVQNAGSFDPISERDFDDVAGVLADRRPPWLADFAGRCLTAHGRFQGLGFPAWPFVRRLVRLGAIGRPATAEYTTLMPAALHRTALRDGAWHQPATPEHALLADRGLLEDEVWRLFTVPGAAWEVQRVGGWAPALVKLAEQGELDRGRLIDACLGAFLRDFPPSQVDWYARLHEHLEPSVPELTARAGTYLALLGAAAVPAVQLAQQVTSLLLDKDLLDVPALLTASAPALGFPRKNIAAAQLKLIGRVIRSRPEARDAALAAAAQAFTHERTSIQEAALKLITRHGLPDGPARAEICELAASLAPSLAIMAARLGIAADHGGPAGDAQRAASQVGRAAAPAGSLDTAAPASSLDTAAPAGSLDSADPAGPLDSAGPAGPLSSAESARPLGSTGPARPLGSTGPARPLGSTGPAGPLDSAGPARPLSSAGQAAPGHSGLAELAGLAGRIAALPDRVAEPLRAALARARAGEVVPPAAPQPAAGEPLPPHLADPAELLELFTRLLEEPGDPLAVERVLGGAVRLAGLPPALRRQLAAPLLRRACNKAEADHHGPFSGCDPAADVARLLLAWAGEWDPRDEPWEASMWDPRRDIHRSADPKIMSRLLTTRIREASAVISAGKPATLLAEPEFERGAVSQQRLLERLIVWYRASGGRPPTRYDLDAALLRLEPGAGEDLWAEWARLDAATATQARRSYAEAQQQVALSPVTGTAIPDRFFQATGDILVLARTGPSSGAEETLSWAALTALSDPLRDHHLLYGQRWELRRYDPLVAGWPLLAPWQPELIAAHLLRPLSDGLRPGRTPATTAVTCLAHPGHALGPIGHLALVTGLASAEPDTRIAAAAVWDRACLDGRLDPQLAADAIITGAAGKAVKLNRVADGLRHATGQPLAAYRAVETICRCGPALLESRDLGLPLLLRLAADLAAAVGGPDLPAPLTVLAARPGRSRTAAAASLLAQAAAGPVPDRPEAAAQALAALVTRAEARPGASLRS